MQWLLVWQLVLKMLANGAMLSHSLDFYIIHSCPMNAHSMECSLV